MRRFFQWIIPLGILLSLPACSQSSSPAPRGNNSSTPLPSTEADSVNENPAPSDKSMNEVQEEHQKRLLAIPGVVGIGQGISQGKPCFRIYVDKLTPELSAKIPREIEGYPVVILQTGEIKAY